MIRLFLVALALTLWAGCAGAAPQTELTPDHPTNPKARESAYLPPPNHLGSAASIPDGPSPVLPTAAPAKVESLTAETKKSLGEIFKKYEGIRALLAADKVEGIPVLAEDLGKSAKEAEAAAPEALRAEFKTLQDAAQKLGHAEHLGLDPARKAFGDLSRTAIRIASAVPDLEQNRKVFKCLMMKKGYAKWIQTGSTASNPYFGKEMLECGNESDWKE